MVGHGEVSFKGGRTGDVGSHVVSCSRRLAKFGLGNQPLVHGRKPYKVIYDPNDHG